MKIENNTENKNPKSYILSWRRMGVLANQAHI